MIGRRRSRIDDQEAARLWTDELYSLQMIANVMGVTRTGIKKALNRQGVDTSTM